MSLEASKTLVTAKNHDLDPLTNDILFLLKSLLPEYTTSTLFIPLFYSS